MKEFDENYIKEDLVKDRKKYKDDVFNSNLQIEMNDRKEIEVYGYDFVPRSHHWTNMTEQKIEVNRIEGITDNK